MTCQRESELIRIGLGAPGKGRHMVRAKKARKKRKAFCIPLTLANGGRRGRTGAAQARREQGLDRERRRRYMRAARRLELQNWAGRL
jgi:hypothetical protein